MLTKTRYGRVILFMNEIDSVWGPRPSNHNTGAILFRDLTYTGITWQLKMNNVKHMVTNKDFLVPAFFATLMAPLNENPPGFHGETMCTRAHLAYPLHQWLVPYHSEQARTKYLPRYYCIINTFRLVSQSQPRCHVFRSDSFFYWAQWKSALRSHYVLSF